MEPLKNLYSTDFYEQFCDVLQSYSSDFDRRKFLELIFDSEWEKRELKDRMRHTTSILHQFMPHDFPEAAALLSSLTVSLKEAGLGHQALQYLFIPHYIETYGIDHLEESSNAIELVTQFTSCEFAVRPFIVNYQERMMDQMKEWSTHENHHVRRLASEGSRPRLPWAMALPSFKKDPSPILPILENLKQDTSEYVRRSVANNLNDIIKDHPEVVLTIMAKWKGLGKETDYILKHGSRTLLKQGHAEALKHFGLQANAALTMTDFKIQTPEIRIGHLLTFSFTLKNESEIATKVRVEYGLYFRKANGTLSKKVFKISEKELAPNEKSTIVRTQSFRLITTRVFHAGEHQLSIIVNGEEKGRGSFQLTVDSE